MGMGWGWDKPHGDAVGMGKILWGWGADEVISNTGSLFSLHTLRLGYNIML